MRVHPATRFLSFFLASLMTLPSTPYFAYGQSNETETQEVLIFGPQTLTRTNGKKNEFHFELSLNEDTSGPFILKIVNGDESGANRLSSAWFYLNGELIAGPDEFTPEVGLIEKEIQLSSTNQIDVTLASSPGSFLTFNIYGYQTIPGDTTPPNIQYTLNPEPNQNNWLNSDTLVTFLASDNESGLASVSDPVLVSTEGENQSVIGEAYDNAGNRSEIQAILNIDKTPPVLSIDIPESGETVDITPLTTQGSVQDNLSGIDSVQANGVQANVSGNTWQASVPVNEGENLIQVTAQDLAGNASEQTLNVIYSPEGPLPPDPSTVAPPIDPTFVTNVYDAISFLFEGDEPIQTGVGDGAIDPEKASLIQGKIIKQDGNPLGGVSVFVKGHPELGSTLSRIDGKFDLAINGDSFTVLGFEKEGYLPVERKLDVDWQVYAHVNDIAMIELDPSGTLIDFTSSSEPYQVVKGTTVNDSNGTRQATLLIPQGTQAFLKLQNGSTVEASSLTIRATEYTIGENGPSSMPADLTPNNQYTYCVELSADEALNQGATSVTFSQSLPFYVENFLNFPVGTAIPMAFYDREKRAWIPEANGRIIQILSISSGLASIDIDGDQIADDDTVLNALGIFNSEKEFLASNYVMGQSIWRAQINHFSPCDLNFGSMLPFGWQSRTGDRTRRYGKHSNNNTTCGSIIETQNQVLKESLDITGTPYELWYSSGRVPGHRASYVLDIPLSGDLTSDALSNLLSIDLIVRVAGQVYRESFPAAPFQNKKFEWDRLDTYGRTIQGQHPAKVIVSYVYNGYAIAPDDQATSWGQVSGPGFNSPLGFIRVPVRISDVEDHLLGLWDSKGFALGGWGLNILHAYDPRANTLYKGNGDVTQGDSVNRQVVSIAGIGYWGIFEEGMADTVALAFPYDVAYAPDGSYYISLNGSNQIARVSKENYVTLFAGATSGGGYGYGGGSGDGLGDEGPATEATLNGPSGLALGPDGSLYFADTYHNRIRKITPDGIIHTIAGNDNQGYNGDEIEATSATLSNPSNLIVDKEGSIFIADSNNHRIRKITPDGIIHTYAGTGTDGYNGDGISSRSAHLNYPQDIALDSSGNLYIADSNNHRIRRVRPNGLIETVAGNGSVGNQGDEGLAISANIPLPNAIAISNTDELYIADGGNRIKKVDNYGNIFSYAGKGDQFFYNNAPANQIFFGISSQGIRGLTFDPKGNLVFASSQNYQIVKVLLPLPGFNDQDIAIASNDGSLLYRFNSKGKHLSTVNAFTGAPVYDFTYNAQGFLSQVRDGDGNTTIIERNGSGTPTAIISPFGHRNTIQLNADGYLEAFENPMGEAYQMTYENGGNLKTFTSPKGNYSTFTYDDKGLLIKDEDNLGGFSAFERTEDGDNQFTITRTTAEGKKAIFVEKVLPSGEIQSSFMDCDCAEIPTIKIRSSDGRTTTLKPDGTSEEITEGPDPRFGMQSPILSSIKIRTPSGLTMQLIGERSTNLFELGNPLALDSQTDTMYVNGKIYQSIYDANTHALTMISPLNRQRSYTFDEQGRIVQSVIPGLVPLNLSYDDKGRLVTITETDGGLIRNSTLTYDSQSNVEQETDPENNIYQFEYDLADRLTKQILPDQREINFGYDLNSNVTKITPPGKPDHTFEYNDLNFESAYIPPDVGLSEHSTLYQYTLDKEIEKITRPDGQELVFTYNDRGLLVLLSYPTGLLDFTYDDTTGKLTNISTGNGESLTYDYDGELLLSTTWGGTFNHTLSRTHDNFFRIVSQTLDGTIINFGYDDDSLLVYAGDLEISRDPSNGLITETYLEGVSSAVEDMREYNSFGEIVSYVAQYGSSNVASFNYARDNLGRITQKIETIAGATNTFDYVYDSTGRLTDVSRNGTLISHYEYDSNGNRTLHNGTLGTYDDQDRLLTYGDFTFTYSANGELETKTNTITSEVTTYNYDVLGNLLSVNLPDGRLIEYIHDGQNRRIGKKVNGTLVKGWLYQDSLNPVAELDGSGNVTARYVYGSWPFCPDYMVKSGQTYRIIQDHLGSPRQVVNVNNGQVMQSLEYDEFGVVLNNSSPAFQPFGFAGGLYDEDTGLVRFGARDYDATTGRWTAKDPTDFGGGDTNIYRYCFGDPVNYFDTHGKAAILLTIGILILTTTYANAPSNDEPEYSGMAEGNLELALPFLLPILKDPCKGSKLYKYLFEKNKGLLNDNPFLRIGEGWKGTKTLGKKVFRIAWGKKGSKWHGHIDLF